MEKVSFELFGLTLLEPLSSVMNWVLGALCYYFFTKLRGTDSTFLKYWSWFFLLFGLSFLFGGFSHLFYEYLGLNGKIPGWGAAVLGVSAAESALVLGMNEKKKQTLTAVIRSKFFATLVLLFIDLSFKWVMVHTAGFWIMAGIISVNRMRAGQKDYKYFLYGMSSLLLIGVVKIGKIDIDPAWFNRDDIAHFIMLGLYWMFYKAVRQIADNHSEAQQSDSGQIPA